MMRHDLRLGFDNFRKTTLQGIRNGSVKLGTPAPENSRIRGISHQSVFEAVDLALS